MRFDREARGLPVCGRACCPSARLGGVVRWALVLVACGCGRLGFDARRASPDALASDSITDDSITDDSTTDGDVVLTGLIAWYPMNGGSATATQDATGHGHDAACAPPACPTAFDGVHDGALLFDGVDDHLIAPGSGVDPATGSVATWFRLDVAPAAGDYAELFQKGYMNNPSSFEAGFVATGQELGCGGDSIIANQFAETTWPSLGVWHHIACVWDATTVRTYVDGSERSSHDFSVAYDTRPLTFGANNDNGALAGFFHGELDDLRIYDRALAPAEIALLATP